MMGGHYRWLRAYQLFQDQKVRKQNLGPGRQMAPPPQEKDSMVSEGLDLQGICGWHELQRQGLDLEYSGSITN